MCIQVLKYLYKSVFVSDTHSMGIRASLYIRVSYNTYAQFGADFLVSFLSYMAEIWPILAISQPVQIYVEHIIDAS